MRSAMWTCGLVLALVGCAQGGDGLNPRGEGDGGGRTGIDARVPERDAAVPSACDPACISGDVCRDGVCVPVEDDEDGDGVPAGLDCDDTDPAVASSAERECNNECGTGLERCTDGVWGECDAPSSCECPAGAAPRTVDCTRCGTQRQVCTDGTWTNDGGCMDMGACALGETETRSTSCGECGEGTRTEVRSCTSGCTWGSWMPMGSCSTSATCSPGETDRETRACSGGCGMTEQRARSCNSSTCKWGSYGSWSGCSPCGPVCGNGTCESGETCSNCADCRYGHGGNGNGGDSCAGVPAETWRCVYSSSLGGNVSQVCRSGSWVNFNFNPRGCSACRCSFSLSCCQAGFTGSGCS